LDDFQGGLNKKEPHRPGKIINIIRWRVENFPRYTISNLERDKRELQGKFSAKKSNIPLLAGKLNGDGRLAGKAKNYRAMLIFGG